MSNDQYLELFLSEAEEILTLLNQRLIYLEKNPQDKNSLAEFFRGCHTLKGNAAAMGMPRIQKLAHAMENILVRLRASEISLTPDLSASLFDGLDLLSALVRSIQSNTDANIDESLLLEKLANVTKDNPILPKERNKKLLIRDEIAQSSGKIKSIRVNLENLESLMNTVAQLHINKIRLSELSRQHNDKILSNAINEMELTVNQLQTEMMLLRLLPLKYIFNNFPRLVRDDARKEGKEIKLSIEGENIGLDRAILDEINDPLVHILRNAVSHGIESPEERKKRGKTLQGNITIVAQQEQNMVLVKIHDDGCGLDPQRIRTGLQNSDLIAAETLERLSDQDILHLISLPGFSLSKKVTERAGRGMGMNIVKNKVEGIGGNVSIQSELGQGTTFILRLPISMAIVHALLIRVAEETYAIPLYNIIESIKLDSVLIKHVNNQKIVSYRNEALPLLSLQEILHKNTKNSTNNEKICVVVCEINHQKIGLIVEELIGEEEIVTKNLTGFMENLAGYSGATILGSGRVAMILDLAALLN